MTLSLETKKHVIELRKLGYTYKFIAELAGVSSAWARDTCVAAKVRKPTKQLGRVGKYSEEQIEAVLHLRRQGYVHRAIAELMSCASCGGPGMSIENINRICKIAGLPGGQGHLGRLPQGPYRSEEERQEYVGRRKEIREMREAGMRLRVIGEKYGITRERVRQICVGIDKPDLRPRLNCELCGVEFIAASRDDGGHTSYKYCSRECGKKGMSLNSRKPESKWSRHGTVKLTCSGCGVDFERTNYIASIGEATREAKGCKETGNFYCSRECYWENHSGWSRREESE